MKNVQLNKNPGCCIYFTSIKKDADIDEEKVFVKCLDSAVLNIIEWVHGSYNYNYTEEVREDNYAKPDPFCIANVYAEKGEGGEYNPYLIELRSDTEENLEKTLLNLKLPFDKTKIITR